MCGAWGEGRRVDNNKLTSRVLPQLHRVALDGWEDGGRRVDDKKLTSRVKMQLYRVALVVVVGWG